MFVGVCYVVGFGDCLEIVKMFVVEVGYGLFFGCGVILIFWFL